MQTVLVALILVDVLAAGFIALGGLRGRRTANPWWGIVAVAGIVICLHVLDVYFPEAGWVPWASLVAALLGGVPAALKERDLVRQGVMTDFGDREQYVDIGLFFVAITGVRILMPFLPDQPAVALVQVTFVPLLLLRWTIVRLRPAPRDA